MFLLLFLLPHIPRRSAALTGPASNSVTLTQFAASVTLACFRHSWSAAPDMHVLLHRPGGKTQPGTRADKQEQKEEEEEEEHILVTPTRTHPDPPPYPSPSFNLYMGKLLLLLIPRPALLTHQRSYLPSANFQHLRVRVIQSYPLLC